jgi:hypothetical protein
LPVDVVDRLRFRGGRLGYVRVSDGSVVVLRVAIVDARPRGEASPFGVEFEVNATGGIAVYPSEEVLREVRDKPVVEPGRLPQDGWEMVDIVEKSPAYEEALYSDEVVGSYLVRVEIEPLMVSRNTLYRNPQGQPLYVVRWVPKVTWREAGKPGG